MTILQIAETYEFRVYEEGKKWLEIEPTTEVFTSWKEASDHAMDMSTEAKTEVRANTKGSLQGRYFRSYGR